ncbi:hypothetical protein QTP70_005095 [Hemibagrus guttatus]|uniref:Protein prenyltransferase alpha subunit repeat-containing protein 1 n=1 Tax=Hemibagrus guttatus TaxID=175788 RepID=A0AAE0Q6Y6_9TELE|nr:hypothetical protein QTP70_005095 [Hemibagrus guttatus]
MAESEEEVDVLVQRVVKDITNAFKRNPGIDEIGLIPCPEARYNRSPIVLVENKLGVESWCVKFLLPYVHNKLLLYRQRKQWLDREVRRDEALRKELLQCGVLNPEKDLYLGKLALTKYPKSPETWIHRRWVLQSLQKELCGADERSDYSEQIQRTVHEEMKVCADAAGRYPSNYNAWSHRIWVLQHMAKGNLKILHDELSSTKLWVSMHVSDHSGFHYRQFLLKALLAELGQVQQPNRGGSADEPHTDTIPQLFHDEIELCTDLTESYPGHETLWCHRAPVEIGLLLVEEIEEGGECTDRERRGKVGCELEEKERFWSELDEVMESIPTSERVVIGADFNGHVGEGNRGDEEVMGKFGVKERNFEGQMVVDFAKRMDMAVVNTYFQKREEHRVTYKSGGRRTQIDYILCRRGNLKEISVCKVVVGESVARQHRMVLCRMTLMVCKKKRSKIEIEKKTKWWKLKKEECCEEFRQKLRQALGGQVVLPDDWETTAEVIRETGRKVLGVSSGRRKEDKETWWWNEEVQDSIQRKRLAKKKWDMDRTEENRQEYKELQRRVKREVSKAKKKACDELYTREGEKDLYRRHVFYLWHHWRNNSQEQGPLSPGHVHNLLNDSSDPSDEDRRFQAMDVDCTQEGNKQGGYTQDSKRLKRGPPCPTLPSEHTFISRILSSCRNPEQGRFANAYRKWLDSVIEIGSDGVLDKWN